MPKRTQSTRIGRFSGIRSARAPNVCKVTAFVCRLCRKKTDVRGEVGKESSEEQKKKKTQRKREDLGRKRDGGPDGLSTCSTPIFHM